MSEPLTYRNIDPNVRRLIMLGLGIAMFAACFDGTIITTLQKKITDEWGTSGMIPMMMTGYLIFETLFIPIAGKLSDLYGRKKLFLIGLFFFTLASVLSALAWSPEVLVLARAVQGVGGGILIPVATAAVSDLYAPEYRGNVQGALAAVFGIGMGAGPFIGGLFATFNWRLAFWINVPLAIISFILTSKEFPAMENEGVKKIDFKGLAVLMVLLLSLILYFETKCEYIILLMIGVISIFVFYHVESKAEEAIIAPHVFSNKTVRQSAVLYFLFGFSLVGIELFSSMYSQKVLGMSPFESGMYLVILVIGLMLTSVISGGMVAKTGSKIWVVAGTAILVISLYMFSQLTSTGITSEKWYYGITMFLFGFGGGCMTTPVITAVQYTSKPTEVGMTTSAVNLVRNIGSTVSTTVFTLVASVAINASASGVLPASLLEELGNLGVAIIDKIGKYGADVDAAIRSLYSTGIGWAFFMGMSLMLIALIISFFYKDVRYTDSEDYKRDHPEEFEKKE